MIKYALKCTNGHQFDSWFQNSGAFDKLRSGGHVSCVVCGSGEVEKAIMAPRVTASKKQSAPPAGQENTSLREPMSEAEKALKKFRAHVEANSEDVGDKFVDEVRAMHYGDAPGRSIIGEARINEAKELISEGIPVTPMPWSTQKTN